MCFSLYMAGVNVLACFLNFKCNEKDTLFGVYFVNKCRRDKRLKNAPIGTFGTSVCEKT